MEIHATADSAFYHFRVPTSQNSNILGTLFTLSLHTLDPRKVFKCTY